LAEGNPNTIPHLTGEKLRRYRFPKPPFCEQRAIADFLDAETAKLDTLVAKRQELIEKLKEKRSALISCTFTRGLPPEAARAAGLNPNPKLKPSGIEWLGEIPEHWEIFAARRLSRRIITGSTPPTAEERYYEDGTVPWYGPGSFDEQITLSRPVKLLHSSAIQEDAARLFCAGATMIVTIGATLGKVSSLTEPSSCNQQITVVEFDERLVHPRFGTYQIKRLELTLRTIAPSATLSILSQGDIGDIFLGLPPLSEQRVIADYLDRETNRIDRMVRKVEDAIDRLQEYRTALITAAVTGKIDVRGYRNRTETM
jgi:type I restriction enzyme S subunit